MKKHPFHLRTDETLIEAESWLGQDEEYCNLALDTVASHTVLDLTKVLMAGYSIDDVITSVQLETAKGPIEGLIFRIHKLEALGQIRRNFEICAYDFLAHNLLTDIDGMLGLDFFKNLDLSISFRRSEITLA